MPRMKCTFEKRGILAVPRGKLRDAFREGIRQSGVRWWTEYLPIHFTTAALRRYRLTKPRTPGYNARKRGRAYIEGAGTAIGDDSPNVFTGHSREVATTVQNIKAIATSADKVRCEVIINAPALNFHHLHDEIQELLVSENNDLQNVYGTESQLELERLGSGERIVTRIAA